MKASDLLVQCLEAEGVTHVFGVPGEENEELLFSLERSSIRFVPTRHEQGAAFIADVYGRLTGKAGVCLATLGPGATNLVTGVADAQLDKSPLVAITGQASTHRLHKESHQFIDVVNMFRPIVKWNTSINRPEIIPEAVRKAFKLAEMEKPGATHLELPEDVAGQEVKPLRPLLRTRVRRPAPDYKAFMQALELLARAERPIIIAGNGAIRKLASRHLRLFVENTHIPVVSTFMGKGAVAGSDARAVGTIGVPADIALEAVEQADVVLCVGYDIAEVDPGRWNPRKDKKIIHIDFSPAEVYEYYLPDVEVVCDISAVLWEFNERLAHDALVFDDAWFQPIRRRLREDIASYADQRLTVPGTVTILRRLLRADDLLISDVGMHKLWIARNYLAEEPNTCIISNGLASMGIAVPGGIAAKLAHPEKRVVAASGDGGFLMNSQEIETAKRLGAGYTIVVFNDNDYGLISWKQERDAGRTFGTKLTNPNFKRYAESFGIRAYAPRTVEELEAALREAIESGQLCLVAVDIDPTVNARLMR